MFYKKVDDPKAIKNGDAIAFRSQGGVDHTFIIKKIVLKDGKIDMDKTKVLTKNGQQDLKEDTLQAVYDSYLALTKRALGDTATLNLFVYTRK